LNTCNGYQACELLLCICAGGNGTTASTCLTASSADCATLQSCFAGYFTCLSSLASLRSTSDNCSDFGATIHTAQLAAMGEDYQGSNLQASCQYELCTIANTSAMASSCDLTADGAPNVCNNVTANGAPVPTFSNSTPTNPVTYAIIASISLSGNNWGSILSSPTLYLALETAVTGDLAALLGIAAQFIEIISMTQGSLMIHFAVLDGSGVTNSALQSSVVGSANRSDWIGSIQTFYHSVNPNDPPLTAQTATAAAETPAPTPSGASVWSVALAFAMAAVGVLAFP